MERWVCVLRPFSGIVYGRVVGVKACCGQKLFDIHFQTFSSNHNIVIIKMPSKKKKYNARFPPARIKKIMQTDEEVGKVAAAVPVIISRALELFVEQLLRKSVEFTLSRNAKTLSPAHLKQCILAENRFDFLKDLVMSIPDVQGDGDDSSSVPGTPVVSAQPPIFRSQSSSDATTSGRRAVGASSRPRGRPRKNHSLPQPASSAKSASDEESDSDLDDEEEEEDDESEPQPKVHKKLNSANGSSSTSLKAAVPMQFNAAQPNFYQEINSVQFQINIPPNNGAPADKTKSNDDDDYDT